MNRAYAMLEVKSTDDETRTIHGIATTVSTDRMDDVVESMGAVFKLPIPLLYQHSGKDPIGWVTEAKVTKKGITIVAQVAKHVHEDVDRAWAYIKSGLVRGLSIGFRPLASEPIKDSDNYGRKFTKWEWLELSAVTVPANQDASITAIKSIDSQLRAASGRDRTVRLLVDNPPGVTGTPQPRSNREANVKTLAEQIASFEATRAVKAARQNEVMQKAVDDGRTTDEAEREEFDTLQDEIKAIDDDLNRLKQLETTNRTAATPAIIPPRSDPTGIQRQAPSNILLKQELPKGTAFTRFVMALAASRGNRMEAAEFAKRWHNSTPEVETVLRAAVAAGTTTDADWAQPLVAYRTMADEFIELLRPATIIGRIAGLRRVPFNIKIPVQTQGSLVNWVGETKPKPVGELKFIMMQLDVNKVAGIVVLSEELVRLSTPSAEAIVRQDLVAQVAQFLDAEFIDPANVADPGISPASILNGITGIPSSGTSAGAARADLAALQTAFINANLGVGGATYITTEIIAQQLGMLQNPLGQPEFAGMVSGNTLNRGSVIASQAVPAGILALILPSEILVADDGGVTIDASREATLQMNDTPVAGTAATFSLWQNNCVGIRAERWITWRRRRDQAVAFVTGANYTGAVTSP